MATEGMPPAPPPDELAEIREVVGRAKRGDAAAVPRLRELLDQHPAVWEKYGDLAAQVEQSWIGLAAGNDLHLKESVTRFAGRLRTELTRPSASAVERLLVERAVATWLMANYFSGVEVTAIAGDAPPKLLQLRATRQAQAQRQHERALSALAVYQRLYPGAVPARELAPVADPVPVAAPPAVAVERPQPPRLDGGSEPDVTESFESIPAHRPAERVRVGQSN